MRQGHALKLQTERLSQRLEVRIDVLSQRVEGKLLVTIDGSSSVWSVKAQEVLYAFMSTRPPCGFWNSVQLLSAVWAKLSQRRGLHWCFCLLQTSPIAICVPARLLGPKQPIGAQPDLSMESFDHGTYPPTVTACQPSGAALLTWRLKGKHIGSLS